MNMKPDLACRTNLHEKTMLVPHTNMLLNKREDGGRERHAYPTVQYTGTEDSAV